MTTKETEPVSQGEQQENQKPSQLKAYKKHVQVPVIQEQIPIMEEELLHMLQDAWPGRIPDDASIYPDESGEGGKNCPVVTVQWDREPRPGEFESLEAAQRAREEGEYDDYDEIEDEDEDEDVDDRFACTGCGRSLRELHARDCSRRSRKSQRVVGTDCKQRGVPKKTVKKKGPRR